MTHCRERRADARAIGICTTIAVLLLGLADCLGAAAIGLSAAGCHMAHLNCLRQRLRADTKCPCLLGASRHCVPAAWCDHDSRHLCRDRQQLGLRVLLGMWCHAAARQCPRLGVVKGLMRA